MTMTIESPLTPEQVEQKEAQLGETILRRNELAEELKSVASSYRERIKMLDADIAELAWQTHNRAELQDAQPNIPGL